MPQRTVVIDPMPRAVLALLTVERLHRDLDAVVPGQLGFVEHEVPRNARGVGITGHPCVGCAREHFPRRIMLNAYDAPRAIEQKLCPPLRVQPRALPAPGLEPPGRAPDGARPGAHRRPAQPAGAQCGHRGRAGRRARPRLLNAVSQSLMRSVQTVTEQSSKFRTRTA